MSPDDGLARRLSEGWTDSEGQRHVCHIPDIAIAESARIGVPLAHTVTLLDVESSGGRNIFGAPKTSCGQRRWSTVTEATYVAYRARRDECGSQGVGPMQITWPATQDIADEQGGCWRPEINVRVGLVEFARLMRTHSQLRDVFSAYNTGKPGDTDYARKALSLLGGWQQVADG